MATPEPPAGTDITGKTYLDWDLPDPTNLSTEDVRALREDIRAA